MVLHQQVGPIRYPTIDKTGSYLDWMFGYPRSITRLALKGYSLGFVLVTALIVSGLSDRLLVGAWHADQYWARGSLIELRIRDQ